LLVHGRWFSPGTLASSPTKTDRHDIAEILLKVALSHLDILLIKQAKELIRESRTVIHVDKSGSISFKKPNDLRQ
jgi:hypothetical protein